MKRDTKIWAKKKKQQTNEKNEKRKQPETGLRRIFWHNCVFQMTQREKVGQ